MRGGICSLTGSFQILATVMLFTIPSKGTAEESIDTCGDVLSAALLTKRDSSNAADVSESERYWACSASYTDIRQYLRGQSKDGKSASGSYKYGDISIKGGKSSLSEANSTNDQIAIWKQDNCASSDRNANMSAAAFLSEQFVGPGAIEAWSKCMLNLQGLQCVARKQGSSEIDLTVSYKSDDGYPLTVGKKDFFVKRGNSSSREYIDHDGRLLIGRRSYSIDRTSNVDTSIRLNAVKNMATLSCSVFVPKDEPVLSAPPSDSFPDFSGVVGAIWCASPKPVFKYSLRSINAKEVQLAMGTDRISQELWPVTTYRVFGFKDRLIGMYTLHQEARTEPILGYPPSPRMYRVEVIQFERGDLTKWLTFSTNHPTADKITNVVANGKKITLQTCK